jgi:hypothetical protein
LKKRIGCEKIVMYLFGEVSERLKEHDWKLCVPPKGTEGSNPSLSVLYRTVSGTANGIRLVRAAAWARATNGCEPRQVRKGATEVALFVCRGYPGRRFYES